MRRVLGHILNGLALLSAALFVAACVLWARSYCAADGVWVSRRPYCYLYSSRGAMGVCLRPAVDRSVMWHVRVGGEWVPHPADDPAPWKRAWGAGNHAGPRVPHAALALAAAVAPLRAARRRRRRRRRARSGLCPSCGYDLRATPGRCPECGATTRPAGVAAPRSQAGQPAAAPAHSSRPGNSMLVSFPAVHQERRCP